MTDPVAPDGTRAALAAADALARTHALASETLALSRTHGRVLARDVVADGGVLLAAGRVLTPLRVAVAAAHGMAALEVVRRPTVAVFTVGDHLVPPGMPRAEGQTFDATRELVIGLLRADGLEPTAWPSLPEDAERIEIAMRDAGCAFDVIVICSPPTTSGFGAVARVVGRFGEVAWGGGADAWGHEPFLGHLDEACVLALPDHIDTVLDLYTSIGRALFDGLQRRTESR